MQIRKVKGEDLGRILSLRFNQNHGCFIANMDKGIQIFNVEPLTKLAHYDVDQIGSVTIGEMLNRTNLLAVVSGGAQAKYADNAVLIFDDSKKEPVLEFTFASPVLNVIMKKDRLIVALINSVHVFTFPTDPQCILTCQTRSNPTGICVATPSQSTDRQFVAYPGHKMGSIQIMALAAVDHGSSSAPTTINAHQTELACLSMNATGTLLASASQRGTLLRVWDTNKRILLHELRRGADPAKVYCANFSADSEFLCCSSDKGTIHIFALKNPKLNRRSSFSKMSFLGTYVESQWALATCTVPPECACVCAFGQKNTLYVICIDGTFHKYVFNVDGGCNRESFDVFLELCQDEEF